MVYGYRRARPRSLADAALCTVLVCLLEAFTSQIDNLFLPVYYSAILLSLAT